MNKVMAKNLRTSKFYLRTTGYDQCSKKFGEFNEIDPNLKPIAVTKILWHLTYQTSFINKYNSRDYFEPFLPDEDLCFIVERKLRFSKERNK